MIEVFAEYGVIGVMVMLFAGQMIFLQKTLMAKLMEIEKILGQMNYLTDDVNFLKGRINGGNRG